MLLLQQIQQQDFNPRSHERSDTKQDILSVEAAIFQSTLPREERLSDFSSLFRVFIISIHAPTRGATGTELSRFQMLRYFNPRSHERSDLSSLFVDGLDLISIHAPTRGATHSIIAVNLFNAISIHAPTRGATFLNSHCLLCMPYFNPRSHERSDIVQGIKRFVYFFYTIGDRNICTKNLFIFIQYRQ